MRACEQCGAEFEPSADWPQKRFCTIRCRQLANARRKPQCFDVDQPLAVRFTNRYRVTSSGCWEWTGTRKTSGYGIAFAGAPERRAHRLSWLLAHGPIPQGMSVLHKCDNPPCVNPEHLFLGDHAVNAQDYVDKGLMRHVNRRDGHGRWTA
jgi:HNH endonuclease